MGNPITWANSISLAFTRFKTVDAARFLLNRAKSKISQPASDACLDISLRGYAAPVRIRAAEGDYYVLRQVLLNEEYADPSPAHRRAMQNFYIRCLQSGRTPVIIDCGANIGMAAVWYARLYPQARIFSIEPDAANFALLQHNVAPYPNVTPIMAAISHKNARVRLLNEEGGAPYAWQTIEDADGPVESVTIRSLQDRVPEGALFIVKIDIEGFETDLFQANVEWVDSAPLIVFEAHDRLFPWRGTAEAILSVLMARGKRDYLQDAESTFCYSRSLLHEAPSNEGAAAL